MLEFVKKDKLEMVSNKIKNIYVKRIGKDKTTFINNFVDKYKDNPALLRADAPYITTTFIKIIPN